MEVIGGDSSFYAFLGYFIVNIDSITMFVAWSIIIELDVASLKKIRFFELTMVGGIDSENPEESDSSS